MSVSLSLSLEQFHCFWYSRYFCNTRKTCTSRYFWTCRTISIRCMLHILFWIPAPAGPKIYISVVPDLVGLIKELPWKTFLFFMKWYWKVIGDRIQLLRGDIEAGMINDRWPRSVGCSGAGAWSNTISSILQNAPRLSDQSRALHNQNKAKAIPD